MKCSTLVTLVAALALPQVVEAQAPVRCKSTCTRGAAGSDCGSQAIEPKPEPWKGYQKGVRWEESLDDAKARAAKEGKPILFYQLVGDLDKEGC